MNVKSVMIRIVSVKKKVEWSKFLVIIIFLSLFASCSGGEPAQDSFRIRIIDDWRFTYRRSFILMSLKANGNWESQVREEGQFSRIVEKKGQQRGTWELLEDDKYLRINVETGDELDVGWKPGNSYQYLITSLTEDKLIIVKEDSGKVTEWSRVRAKKKTPQSEEGPLITTRTIPLVPIITNLTKRSPFSKERYICVNFEIVENLEKPTANPEEVGPTLPIHPRLRENIMLYLSSLKYREINTFDEVKVVRKKLELMISTYFSGRLKELKLENIIVAGSRGSLEEFVIQYPDQMVRFGLKPPGPPPKEEAEEGDGDAKKS